MKSSSRYPRPWSWMVFALHLACSSLAHAADPEPAPQTDDATIDGLSDETLFVLGNTLFAVYHELGHALIDLLALPVVGREEDAVDGLAAVTMIPEEPDKMGDALIVAVADGWRVQSDVASGRRERRYWGEHALDEQRHFAIVCLMVGSDQDGFYDYALEAGLPEARIGTCRYDFESMKTGWKELLHPHESEEKPVVDASINLVFEAPLAEQERVVDLVRQDRILEDAILSFGDRITLPSTVTIRFAVCEEANAYWSPREQEVRVCYELIDAFSAILLDAIAG